LKALSSWSLDRVLGRPRIEAGLGPHRVIDGSGGRAQHAVTLLELPAELRRRGYDTVQLCHFHLPSRRPDYLEELRSSLAESEIALDAVLIDDGDLTEPDHADADEAWIAGWLDDALTLGARRARVIAGRSAPTPDALRSSAKRLRRLALGHEDVRVVTENWHELTPGPEEVIEILDRTDGAAGLLIDLGNWSGRNKYRHLARVADFAETCHAKCHFLGSEPESDDFARSLAVLKDSGYTGALALVYDGEDSDEWGGLERENTIVLRVLGSAEGIA
jgi:hypothetical protein